VTFNDEKQAIRERVWALLDHEGVVPPDVRGRIPNFQGADRAADLLASTEVWRDARTVKANPDWPQLPVRARALSEGKRVYMAVPRMAAEKPFFLLDPHTLDLSSEAAADPRTAADHAQRAAIEDMQSVDVVVCGCVAVNQSGARLGKGAGYSDLEVALLIEAGLVTDATVIVTTVHDLQVIDDDIPEAPYDFRVDVIATPSRLIRCGNPRRPAGIIQNNLRRDQIEAIPALSRRFKEQRT
jgi:5-formyltetrahydrofolate cyclo-ligase